jgi:hypothetical protein
VTRGRDQAVLATVRLVGNQDGAVTVQHAGTDDAVVAVRIGRALIYVHQEVTARHFLDVWDGSRATALALPALADRQLVRSVNGMPEPGVVANAVGRPPCSVVLASEDAKGRRPYLRVQLARVVFEVRDHMAFSNCLALFTEAHALARDVFLPPGSERVIRGAMEIARHAFYVGAERRHTGTELGGTGGSAPGAVPAIRTSAAGPPRTATVERGPAR